MDHAIVTANVGGPGPRRGGDPRPGTATPSTTRSCSAPAWRRRRSLPTRPSPSARGGWSRSCARCRASCRPRPTTSRRRRASSSRPGLETWRGVLSFIEKDLPRAFSRLDDLHILGDLADTSTDAAAAVSHYIQYLENDLAPRAKASFRLGRERFEQKLKLEEGIGLSAEKLLGIALREMNEVQEAFRTVAGKLNGAGDPVEAWRAAKESASRAGHAGRCRAASSSTSCWRSCSGRPSSRCPSPSRWSWRRPPSSTGGRLPACGRPGRSRPRRAAPTTT